MMKDSALELPGFDRDPLTGRYYRKLPTGSGSYFHSINHHKDPKEKSSEGMRPPNVVKLISQRGLGQFVSPKFETNVLESKTKDIHIQRQFAFPGNVRNDFVFADCKLLKRGNGTIIGKWAFKDNSNLCYLGEFEDDWTNLNKKNNPLLNAYLVKKSISDFCECYDSQCRYVIFSAHRTIDNVGLIYLINTHASADARELPAISYINLNIISPVWCCTGNHQKQNFAVGLEKCVGIYTVTRFIRHVQVPGQVHAVEFDKTGNLIFSGLNNGRLVVSDLRSNRDQDAVAKLGYHCIQDVKLSSGEYYVTYRDFGGNIKRVDFRMDLKCVAEYKDFCGSKRPFSFSENFNILCATGVDNIIRLWSLEHGGKPLRYIKSEKDIVSNAIVIDNGSKCVIYHVMNDLVNVYSF